MISPYQIWMSRRSADRVKDWDIEVDPVSSLILISGNLFLN